jgi:hypothetical protein
VEEKAKKRKVSNGSNTKKKKIVAIIYNCVTFGV